MQQKSLDQFDALLFDVYGTLVDWESGILTALQPMLERAKCAWDRKEVMTAFGSVETDIQAQHPDMPYNQLLAEVHATFAKRLGTTTTAPEEDVAFGASISAWPVFPDTVAALADLKRFYKLVVLSNVDNNSFNNFSRPTLEAAGGTFDYVLTAQDIGSYKPNPANFQAALALLSENGVPKERVLVTANSLVHDHAPANALGISSAWIDRKGAVMGIGGHATYDFKFDTLGELAEERKKL